MGRKTRSHPPTIEEMEKADELRRQNERMCKNCAWSRESHHEMVTRNGEMIFLCPNVTFEA